MNILDAARSAYAAGLCLLPVAADGSKRPDVPSWKDFQSARPTIAQMRAFDFGRRAGFGIIAGTVSQCRECWDFDTRDVFEAFVEAAAQCGLGDVVDRIRAGFENETPNGGRRWVVTYSADVEAQDVTLARRPGRAGEPKVKTLIELPTFAIVAPSNGSTHPSGKPYVQVSGNFETIASYSSDERDALIELARSFDRMPKRSVTTATPNRETAAANDRPGDVYNRQVTWSQLLEPAGWTLVFERGDVVYWRRPGKHLGISATTNFGGGDCLFIFSSSTDFEPERSYTKFGAYATLEHGGDFSKAALALVRQGYGEQDAVSTPVSIEKAARSTLGETVATFRRWLSLADPSPVYAVAATLVANRATGDPVWLLLVCAPSTGKTEILNAATRLSWVLPAAKVTEASLLSGTSRRERSTGATGGLLRQVGEFGVLLVKDFTSVLAQNKDARAEAMAALREVYDGSWNRPVGSDGGQILSWHGKCGLIGGVTPALDQFGQVTSALGDRFVLLRLPDADVDAFGAAALRHGEHEHQMRQELRDALAGLVDHADLRHVNRPLTDPEQRQLIDLAAYTARARTAVVRDGYGHDVMFYPQVEGPGRLVKAYARLLGSLEAIGCDSLTAWNTLRRIAIDCAPALRTKAIRALLAKPVRIKTADVAASMETVTKTASRYLEDLSLLRLAVRTKKGDADNSPDLWEASAWLRDYWPESETEKYSTEHISLEGGERKTAVNDSNDNGHHTQVLLGPTLPDTADGRSLTARLHEAGDASFKAGFGVADDLPPCLDSLTEPDFSDPIGGHDE